MSELPDYLGLEAQWQTASPATSASIARPAAKKQRTAARKAINQLPPVDLTAEDIVGNNEGEKGTAPRTRLKSLGHSEGEKGFIGKLLRAEKGFVG
jgi:hypothetical protein